MIRGGSWNLRSPWLLPNQESGQKLTKGDDRAGSQYHQQDEAAPNVNSEQGWYAHATFGDLRQNPPQPYLYSSTMHSSNSQSPTYPSAPIQTWNPTQNYNEQSNVGTAENKAVKRDCFDTRALISSLESIISAGRARKGPIGSEDQNAYEHRKFRAAEAEALLKTIPRPPPRAPPRPPATPMENPSLCFRTLPNGCTYLPSLLHAKHTDLQSDLFRNLVLSSGRLVNVQENISQSGFWVEGDFFITTLQFGPWVNGKGQLSQEALGNDRGQMLNLFSVSTSHDATNVTNPDDCHAVYLWKWNLENDLAVFKPVSQNPNIEHTVPLSLLVESDSLTQYFGKIGGKDIFAVGYDDFLGSSSSTTNSAFEHHNSQITLSPSQNQPLSNWRSLSIGSIRQINSTGSELILDCSTRKGFSGGPIATRYEGSFMIIGHMCNTRSSAKDSYGKLLPSGLRQFLQSRESSVYGANGELGFPRMAAGSPPPLYYSMMNFRSHLPAAAKLANSLFGSTNAHCAPALYTSYSEIIA
ncbi:hypothetical protein TWF481_005538 [Arthrobotrys musiformis]|uniref:Serine protease n=1 Tax=Arthrobotrys musiformis TaxID=47236 RepID=A0AAV9WFH4_9PEZI